MKKYGLSTVGGIVALVLGLVLLAACDPYELQMQREMTEQAKANAASEQARSAVGVEQAKSITDIVAVLSEPNMITTETLNALALAADARDDASFQAILNLATEDYDVRMAARAEAAAVRRTRRFMLNALTWGWLVACFGGGFVGTMALLTGNHGTYIEWPTFRRRPKTAIRKVPRLTAEAGLDYKNYAQAYRTGRLTGEYGLERTNPYELGSTCYDCWQAGYRDGHQARTATRPR